MRFTVLLVMLGMGMGCGGDDSGEIVQRVTCKTSLTGAVTLTDDVCHVFLCTTPEYQDFAITQATSGAVTYQMIPSLAAPKTFAAGTYSITDFRDAADFHVTADGKQYNARATSDRVTDEQATVTVSKVLPPSSSEPCSGAAVGTMSISMVELSFGSSGAVVGPGRVQATVTVTEM